MSNSFVIKMAGIPIGVRALYRQIEDYCSAFLSDGEPMFWVDVQLEDIAFERKRAEEEARMRGNFSPKYSDEYLETLAVYRKIAEQLTSFDIMLIHGSALALDGRGYLFVAESGVGKSTHASLWREKYGERVVMINDDKPLLRYENGMVMVCGTPWMGKHRLGSNTMVPLDGICFLHRSLDNRIDSVERRAGYERLLGHCYRPHSREQMVRTLQLIEKISDVVPLYDLHCNMSLMAVQTAADGMKREK